MSTLKIAWCIVFQQFFAQKCKPDRISFASYTWNNRVWLTWYKIYIHTYIYTYMHIYIHEMEKNRYWYIHHILWPTSSAFKENLPRVSSVSLIVICSLNAILFSFQYAFKLFYYIFIFSFQLFFPMLLVELLVTFCLHSLGTTISSILVRMMRHFA